MPVVLNQYGVLLALWLSKESGVPVDQIITLWNKALNDEIGPEED